ncbi:UNVERIFIED_CONTAM: hypothetical protein Sradi_3432400 [Sesamum radiatum]|uniref:Uncharacterized protein n=1 Tax=Sesamum radiatum TaxID=300843 RepID=A0AAW2R4U5_SESRA
MAGDGLALTWSEGFSRGSSCHPPGACPPYHRRSWCRCRCRRALDEEVSGGGWEEWWGLLEEGEEGGERERLRKSALWGVGGLGLRMIELTIAIWDW